MSQGRGGRFVILAGMLSPVCLWGGLASLGAVQSRSPSADIGQSKIVAVSAAPKTCQVPFEVCGVRSGVGRVCVAIFSGPAGFPSTERAEQTLTVEAVSESVVVELSLLRGETRAIAVFQDLDGNGRLSKNLLGIPVEPYGFSRNARGVLGPPRFDNAALVMPAEGEDLQIQLK